MPTKWMRNRRDDSDLADAVIETITSRCLTTLMRDFDQWPIFIHAAYDFFQRDHGIRSPHPIFLQRHEFDEAHDNAFFASEHAKRNDLIFVEAAHQDTVHFHWPEPSAPRRTNSSEDSLISIRNSCNAGKAIGINGIHTDGNAHEACVLQPLRHVGEQMSVGSHGEIERPSLEIAQCGQFTNKIYNALAQQRARFAAELQNEVLHRGGDPAKSGHVSAGFQRGWMNLNLALSGNSEASIIAECESSEQSAMRNYEAALKTNLPSDLFSIVQDQYAQIKQAHARLRSLERAYKAG